MRSKRSTKLVILLSLVMGASFMLLINVFAVMVFKVHLASGTDLTAYAENYSVKETVLEARRGYIYDSNGMIIAQEVTAYNIICYLREDRYTGAGEVAFVDDPYYTAKMLSDILGADEDYLIGRLTADAGEVELGSLGRNLTIEQKNEIEALDLPGVEFRETTTRSYPLGDFASYLIGFAQSDEVGTIVGKMGIESFLNEEMSGVDGSQVYQAGKNNVILPGMHNEVIEPVHGYDVHLTIDQGIQEALVTSFDMTIERFDADKVWGSVMEVDTGRILAWGQAPSFDPNNINFETHTNYGSQMPYEPGSTMKAFTYAAAIDMGVYPSSEEYVDSTSFCYGVNGTSPYRVPCGDSRQVGRVNNANNNDWGMITYDMGFVYSSNVATSSLLANYMDDSLFYDYLKDFGFYELVETPYISELNGVSNYYYAADKLAQTYGQGSTVTMLQMIQAFSAILSDGSMVQPYFVEEIKSPYDSDDVLFQAQTEVVGQPITETTAEHVQRLMYDTANLDDGTARFYRIEETDIIAKTGTAQVAVNGSYASGQTITSVAIGLPADDPKYLVYYAFEAPYDRLSHVDTEAVQQLLQKIAQINNLTNGNETFDEGLEAREIIESEMPSLVNHSIEYSLAKSQDAGLEAIVLGKGDTVIEQFPQPGASVLSEQKIFLLTDSNSLIMPDMMGWSRAEILDLWEITGIEMVITGVGSVASQSIASGTAVDFNAKVELILK